MLWKDGRLPPSREGPMTVYDPDVPKTAEEIALEDTIADLVYRLKHTREGSAEYKFIERQLTGIFHGSELGGLIIEEYEMRAEVAVPRRRRQRP
ncbi:hypothetical protein [Bradyrhizobium sp. UFLA05-112]